MSRSHREYDDDIVKRDQRIHNLKREQKRREHKRLKAMRRSARRFRNVNDNGNLVFNGIAGMSAENAHND